ncbi:MAG TPA: DUF4159 domain-containing protein [Rhodospirillales bacterium]|jgi:hypothetical protein|nr:DUF4159 domain-containing protein [Rhodospirillales bacterium]
MLTLGAISFAVPWALTGLLALPVIWLLLKLTPPMPTTIRFPPVRLLFGLGTREESAAKTPLWLLIVRLVLAALVILAAAHPLLNADTRLTGKGPLIVLIDDGWAAASNWPARRILLGGFADQAERQSRPVVVITTAAVENESGGTAVKMMTAADARRVFESLQPKPWPTDRARALAPLLDPVALADARPGDVVWLSNGLEDVSSAKDADAKTMADLVAPLQRLGAVRVISDPEERLATVLRPPETDGSTLKQVAERTSSKGMASIWVRAIGDAGRLLAREPMTFAAGKTMAEVGMTLPTELLNKLQRLEIEDAGTAAAVVLMDERWRRRPVGLVSGAGASGDQPLLSELFYLERALKPFSEIRHGTIGDLLKRPLAVMVLADPGRLGKAPRNALENWIKAGGVAIRFAGPLLAKATADEGAEGAPLLPVRLRQGDRVIGGAMSWRTPAKLAPFETSSPFFGFTVPKDVTVERQVLAQPALDLAQKTWARLDDGTPLVTAERRGKGWLVLVHTTANAQWSNLSLSGLFVDMLRRLVAFSQGVVAHAAGPPLEPLTGLDGFGNLGPAAANAQAIPADAFEATRVSPKHPPGYYGSKATRRALNLSVDLAALKAIGPLPSGVSKGFYGKTAERDFRPWLLVLALVLALVDFAASLILRGLLHFGGTRALAPVVLAVLWPVTAGGAEKSPDQFAMDSSLETRLAYVITGDREVDATSEAGLTGLNVLLRRRTAAELGPPQGVDPARDELAFFPLLYWPVTPGSVPSTEAARANINRYLRNGGTILFDTRSAGEGADAQSLRRLARGLDIPPLVPVSPDHVLTRAFYLLKEFPGRWAGGTLWVERAGERINDGVSPVIAGGNDWAAAWALDDAQRPLYPVVPGGERQREMAFRFGVNLVMYTLTGNYKADQVHLPAIMKRLGK